MSYKVTLRCPYGEATMILDCGWDESAPIVFGGNTEAIGVAKLWLSVVYGAYGHIINASNCSPQDLWAATSNLCGFADLSWEGEIGDYDPIDPSVCS